ncbi:unnamed protein product [Mytilus edulis]|uniref:Endonuclease/exonuclease/phosphatase domain-containing protein n=1 Tax=Mytilus edulis TaxID=6550 RepID=A0A8S3UY88_MYTED|nr:unnamed protein product [Mytilus edulis]
MTTNNLKIGLWNIQGLNQDKIKDPYFLNIISNMHLFSLIETWSDSGTTLNIPDYALICNSSRSKHKKGRRNSGGIAIYAKLSLIKGLTKLPNEHSDIQWVKLNHKFFNLPKDIYLAFIYFSPENSSGQPKDIEEMYSKLLCNIENYSQYGEVLIQGDFNAYTSTTPDFVYSDESIYPHAEDDSYIYDIGTPRNNLDHKRPNKSGKLLIELCKEAGYEF